MQENLFEEYKKRLRGEALLKAILLGGAIGFGALALTAFLFWAFEVKQVWIVAIVFAVVTAGLTALFYFLKFKPTDKSIAMRIDSLGLEERVLTMTGLQGDDSPMANLQKQDSLNALSKVNYKLIKITISVALTVWLGVSFVCSAGATVVAALGANGVLKSGKDLYEEWTAVPLKKYTAEYGAETGGKLEGNLSQEIFRGQEGEMVVAVANDEYVFVGWSDGMKTPYRIDKDVKRDIEVTAMFRPINPGNGDDELLLGDSGEPDPDMQEGGMQNKPDNSNTSDKPPSVEYDPANKVIDGQKFYGGTLFEAYYDSMMQEILESESLTDAMKKFIEAYFGAIEQ